MIKILIIDDDPLICKILVKIFTRMDYEVSYSQSLKQGMGVIFANQFDIVFLDVNLPDGNGLEAIKVIREHPIAPEIIIMTGDSDPEGAELAMKSKAWDYIQKSKSQKEFKFSLMRALEYRKQKQTRVQNITIDRGTIIGESPLISKCFEQITIAAGNELPVLITGETGTGKERFSRVIHDNSKQSQSEFIVVDCTVLPEHLVESTLFGHTKGAFTGADFDRTGLMKLADKGTLFLDEVGELPLSVQKKFLRVLQEKRFRPVGSRKEIKSDFRLICATHRNLKNMVKEKQFREDLFFRLFSMNIHLPPLKDRKNDIRTIALHFLTAKEDLKSGKAYTISKEFLDELQMYEWPGNVRELINTIDLVRSEAINGSTLFPHHLPGHIRAYNIRNKLKLPTQNDTSTMTLPPNKNTGNQLNFKDHIEKTKYEYLHELLADYKGNINKACEVSGLSKSQLYRLIQQYNLKGI